MQTKLPDPERDEGPHRTQARRGYHPEDDALRAKGWSLVDRPPGSEAIWRHRDGRTLPQSEALKALGEGK